MNNDILEEVFKYLDLSDIIHNIELINKEINYTPRYIPTLDTNIYDLPLDLDYKTIHSILKKYRHFRFKYKAKHDITNDNLQHFQNNHITSIYRNAYK